MTVKTAVSFTDRHHQYARKKTEEGVYASVSGLVPRYRAVVQEEEERDAAPASVAEAIRARMQTPKSDSIEVDKNDALFDQARTDCKRKYERISHFAASRRSCGPTDVIDLIADYTGSTYRYAAG